MSELPGQPPEFQHSNRTLEQIVADLHRYDREKYGPGQMYDFGPDYGPAYSFEDIFGYPDPIHTMWRLQPQADPTGEEKPYQLIERMAVDVYQYEVKIRESQADQGGRPIPSFEELYGYPDPRQGESIGVADAVGPDE